MTELKIGYQLLDEIRVGLGNLVAEFLSIQAARTAPGIETAASSLSSPRA
jgi:hypothetical protein